MLVRYISPRAVSCGVRTTSASTATPGVSGNTTRPVTAAAALGSGSGGHPCAGPGAAAGGGRGGVGRTHRPPSDAGVEGGGAADCDGVGEGAATAAAGTLLEA